MRRRELLKTIGAGGALALGSGVLDLAALAGQSYVGVNEVGLDDIDSRAISHLKKAERIAIPCYRVGVVTRSGVKASGRSGDVTVETSVQLTGVTLEDMRAIADKAFADFMEQIAETGRPVAPMEEIRSTKGWTKLDLTPAPFGKKPFADARYAVMVAPNDQDLIFTHLDSPLTDKGPASLGNWRALNQMSVDLQAVILLPTVVFDFAELSGSGFKAYSGSASVSVRPGIYVVDFFSGLSAYHAKIALAGDLGRALLKKRVSVGQAGEFVKTAQHDNKAEVQWWNSSVNSGNAAPGSIGPTLAYDISAYDYVVEPAAFESALLDGAHAMNRVFAEAVATIR